MTDNPNGFYASIRDEMYCAADLLEMEFPPINYIVPGIVPEGLAILAGKPKIGKSWMVLDMALAVAMGGHAFGSVQCDPGDVLYIACEDNPRRLQDRLKHVLRDGAKPERLSLACRWPRLDDGGLDAIDAWRSERENPRMVVVDTWARVRPDRSQRKNDYEDDYGALGGLHELANKWGFAIPIVHHIRKMEADDPLDLVAGSVGITGAADTTLVLKRDAQAGTVLYGRGRDLPDLEKAIQFDPMAGRWTIIGEATEARLADIRVDILNAFDGVAGTLSPKQVHDALDGKHTHDAIRQRMTAMFTAGDLDKQGTGQYFVPINPPSQPSQHHSSSVTV